MAPSGEVVIPAEIDGRPVVSIGAEAFAGNAAVTSIAVPASVTNVADGAFEGCGNLQSLRLPLRFHGKTSGMGIPLGCTVEFRGVCALSVSSAFGHPVPEVGRHDVEVVVPTEVSCSVEKALDTGNPGERYACTGWTGTGSVPAGGTGTNVTFEIEEDSSIAWIWETNVWIECSVTGDVASAGLAAWLVKDGAAAAVPFAAAGAPLSWTIAGDADGVSVDPDAGLVAIPTDRPRSVAVAVTHRTTANSVETGEPAAWSGVGAAAGWRLAPDGTATDGWSLRSEEIGSGETASVEIALPCAGTVSFDWRISSARGHYARFYLDGVETNSITRSTQWATVTVSLGDGAHVLRWTYEKGTGATAGEDAAFLDDVRWEPLSLEEALDAANLAWTTDGDAPWTPQLAVSSDGADAAKSGAVSGEEASRLSTTVRGPGTLAWKWKADVAGIAGVEVYLDGADLYDDGCFLEGATDWTAASLEIEGAGEHVVVFEYWNGGTAATVSDCAFIDCVSWTPAGAAGVVVEGVEIPVAWLDENAAAAVGAAGGDYEAAARAAAANGADKVWQCYVSGVSPTNAEQRFEARIGFENGGPVVTWTPDLGDARDYAVLGKTNLLDATWGPTNESTRFFRVKVSMP